MNLVGGVIPNLKKFIQLPTIKAVILKGDKNESRRDHA